MSYSLRLRAKEQIERLMISLVLVNDSTGLEMNDCGRF